MLSIILRSLTFCVARYFSSNAIIHHGSWLIWLNDLDVDLDVDLVTVWFWCLVCHQLVPGVLRHRCYDTGVMKVPITTINNKIYMFLVNSAVVHMIS